MARKGLFIVFLISLLVSFFYFQPFFSAKEEDPSISDRLPVGDFLGKFDVLEVTRESNAFLFYNKIPFRDLLTYEFLLAQGKSYGLDLQKPGYFFANESGEWGALIVVNDSSKISSGINRINKTVEVSDTLIGVQKVRRIKQYDIYMTYGKQWMFFYQGKQLFRRVNQVMYAKKGDTHPAWKKFLSSKQFSKETLIVYSNWKKFKNYGIETAMFAHDCDSIQMHIKSYIKSTEELGLSLKDSGISIADKSQNNKSINLHFDVNKLRNNPQHPICKWLNNFSKRVSFPVNEFFLAWDGDLAFQEGGMQTVKETYIEMELDDEFNVTEVKKEKEVQVPAYAVLLSMNENQKKFISKLFAKGIMTKEDKRFRLLSSPPLGINQKPNFLCLYSADHAPKIIENNKNEGYWTNKRTKYHFSLDSLNSHEAFFSVHFPAFSLLRGNKFL